MSDLARLDAELKEYELAYQMTTPDFLLRVADPHDDLSDVEDASFWRATYEIAEKIRTEGDNTVSDLVARLRVNEYDAVIRLIMKWAIDIGVDSLRFRTFDGVIQVWPYRIFMPTFENGRLLVKADYFVR